MNLLRILLLLGAAWLLWRLYRSYRTPVGSKRDAPKRSGEGYELMARCTRCGVYAPQETLSSSGRCGRCAE